MKLRIASDIHTEFLPKGYSVDEMVEFTKAVLPPLPDDKHTTLVLAGDIGSAQRPHLRKLFIKILEDRFQHIVAIEGNHEYYGGTIDLGSRLCLTIDNRKLVATTLWTDFEDAYPFSMEIAQVSMNDYTFISPTRGRQLYPKDIFDLHKSQLKFIQDNMEEGCSVVTHHLPSFKSIDLQFKDSAINGAYASDLEWLIEEKRPALWIHGHTHAACDYMIDKTRIVCNPRGYGDQYKTNGYNPELLIEV